MKAILLLEDGTMYKGESFGAEGISFGELVFQHFYDRLSRNF